MLYKIQFKIKILTLLIFALSCSSCQKEEISTITYYNNDVSKTKEMFDVELTGSNKYFSIYKLDTQKDFRKLRVQLYSYEKEKKIKLYDSRYELKVETAYIFVRISDNGQIQFGLKAKSRKRNGILYTLKFKEKFDIVYDDISTVQFYSLEPIPLIAFCYGEKDMATKKISLSDYNKDVIDINDGICIFLILTLIH